MGDTEMSKIDKSPCPYRAYILVGRTANKTISKIHSVLDGDKNDVEK